MHILFLRVTPGFSKHEMHVFEHGSNGLQFCHSPSTVFLSCPRSDLPISLPQVVPRDTHPNKTQISILAAQLVNLNRKFYLVCSQSGLPRLSDIHHPDIHHLRHSSPQTFITSDVHHLRHSSPQTFITSDFHHPLPKIRHSSPRTFITSDIHHLRRSSPQTFITPLLNSDIHHLRHSSPPT